MSGGEVAGLVAAGAFVVLVLFCAVPLLKLGKMIDSGTRRVEQSAKIIDEAVGRLQQAGTTVELANANLAHAERVAAHVESISQNVSGLGSIFAATLGGPLVKISAFSYGVRRAAQARSRADVEKELKGRLKAEKVARREDRRSAKAAAK